MWEVARGAPVAVANLKDLDMRLCEKLESLPESTSGLTSHFCVSIFGNLMPEGFGMLANSLCFSQAKLNLSGAPYAPMQLASLPKSKFPLKSFGINFLSNF